jgi:3-phenylpropionate/trans-cinnamate dioxygenase ferredoxin reductase subunit
MDQTPLAVAAVDAIGPDSVAITFETPPEFGAAPGQFVKLSFEVDGDDVSRFYTISSPDVEGTFEITVEIDPEGEVGPLLSELAAGDEVRVAGPFGDAYYEDEDSVVVLAGGPGVGPAVGIAERAVADGGRAAVVYRDDAPVHTDRLGVLMDDGVSVEILAPDESLDDTVAAALDSVGTDPQVFVYGFADFLDDATAALSAADYDADAAKVENFG